MITWMQRHKKWLIITIWISTIAFIGAGFVGWGQYSYGDKAGAVAKVGDIEISSGDLQKAYSNLYAQYNQMFRGQFDKEKAKQFGLERQALRQLTQQALILNLAKEYNLQVSDEELFKTLKSQKFFFNQSGSFDPEVYKQVLSRNNLTPTEYEADMKKQLLIEKTLSLLPIEENKGEKAILDTLVRIADKINYKVLSQDMIHVDSSDAALKPFWELHKDEYKTEVGYEIHYITQAPVTKEYTQEQTLKYYTENKTHFKDKEGKILPLEQVKDKVIAQLNAKATKDAALRSYIAFKKGKNTDKPQTITLTQSDNPFNAELFTKISQASLAKPFLKPILVKGDYIIAQLVKINPAQTKTFEAAKSQVLPSFMAQAAQTQLKTLAQNSVATFNGTTTSFLTAKDSAKLPLLNQKEAGDFLSKLFTSEKKRGYIVLNDGKIVLYDVLEQKLLTNTQNNQNNSLVRLKSAMFNQGIIKLLQNKYKTEIFIQGL